MNDHYKIILESSSLNSSLTLIALIDPFGVGTAINSSFSEMTTFNSCVVFFLLRVASPFGNNSPR